MQIKRKKFWIAFSVIVLCAMVFSIVMSLVTRLKTVTVAFRSTLSAEQTHLNPDVLEKVKNDGEFSYGKILTTMSFNENIKNIEKKNSFVKVEQIVRYFPNRACVFISERITKYRVQAKNNPEKYYILDEEFKVLDIVDAGDGLNEYLDITTEILPSTFTVETAFEEGDFIREYELMGVMKDIMSGVYGAIEGYYFIENINLPTKESLDFEIRGTQVKVHIPTLDMLKENVALAIQCYKEDVHGLRT